MSLLISVISIPRFRASAHFLVMTFYHEPILSVKTSLSCKSNSADKRLFPTHSHPSTAAPGFVSHSLPRPDPFGRKSNVRRLNTPDILLDWYPPPGPRRFCNNPACTDHVLYPQITALR